VTKIFKLCPAILKHQPDKWALLAIISFLADISYTYSSWLPQGISDS